jgi:hypothetical protein
MSHGLGGRRRRSRSHKRQASPLEKAAFKRGLAVASLVGAAVATFTFFEGQHGAAMKTYNADTAFIEAQNKAEAAVEARFRKQLIELETGTFASIGYRNQPAPQGGEYLVRNDGSYVPGFVLGTKVNRVTYKHESDKLPVVVDDNGNPVRTTSLPDEIQTLLAKGQALAMAERKEAEMARAKIVRPEPPVRAFDFIGLVKQKLDR